MSWWKKQTMNKTPKNFSVGEVYEMFPASRSHVTTSYYIEIIEVGSDYIITSIPEYHSLKISYSNNWDYQIPRMKYIGTGIEFRHLLFNQHGLMPELKPC